MSEVVLQLCPTCQLVLTTLAKSLLAAGLTPAALGLPVCDCKSGGAAVVEQTDDKEALVVLATRDVRKIARRDIAWNQQNMRWECETKNA